MARVWRREKSSTRRGWNEEKLFTKLAEGTLMGEKGGERGVGNMTARLPVVRRAFEKRVEEEDGATKPGQSLMVMNRCRYTVDSVLSKYNLSMKRTPKAKKNALLAYTFPVGYKRTPLRSFASNKDRILHVLSDGRSHPLSPDSPPTTPTFTPHPPRADSFVEISNYVESAQAELLYFVSPRKRMQRPGC